jgi:hypothetical protein
MDEKRTEIIFTYEVPIGTEEQQVRYFARDITGVEYPVDKTITVPRYEQRVAAFDVAHDELSMSPETYTEAALLNNVRHMFSETPSMPQARVVSVEHRTYYVYV